jgi:hypothetical protein
MSQTYQIFDQEEIDFVTKLREKNDRTDEFFENSRKKWNDELKPLNDFTLVPHLTQEYAQKLLERQMTALAYRQNMNDEVSFYLSKRSREDVKLKKARADKLVWYAIGSPIKAKGNFSTSQLTEIIDAHVAEQQRAVNIIDSYIEFLRLAIKGMDSLSFNMKYIVEFFNALK